MSHLTGRVATAAVGLTAFLLSVFFCASVGLACLAEYRSPDWQVGHSPLVIIGTVEKVEKGLVQSVRKRGGGDGEGDSGPPTIATVRITEILKGHYPATHVRVGGGPCSSCGGDWYYTFEKGKQYIFILPEYPSVPSASGHSNPQTEKDKSAANVGPIGEAALQWGGSCLPLSRTNEIESEIARLAAYRAEYLADAQEKRPKIYAEGIRLAERMRKEKASWIELEKSYGDARAAEYRKAEEKLGDSLAKSLADTPIEAIYIAIAQDWFCEKADPWWEQSVWDDAMDKLAKSRKGELVALKETWIRKALAHANVEKKYVDEYLKFLEKNENDFSRYDLTFPPDLAGLDVYSRDELNAKEQAVFNSVLTTDFILRYHTHYRGMMLPAYAGEFSAEVLAGLDPKRVRLPIVGMYYSDNERLRWLAQQAIGYMPGTDFVDLPLESMVENGKPWAWRVLDHSKSAKQTAERLGAMIDLASEEYGTWQKAVFWDTLRAGECFHPVCIDKAIAALERIARTIPNDRNGKNSRDPDEERAHLAPALHSYLDAAKARRSAAKPATSPAAVYRQWFKDHPPKKEGSEESE